MNRSPAKRSLVRGELLCLTLCVLLAIGALALRLPALADRPMHADEAVQAARFQQLWWAGGYRYDPNEFHGPTLSYATVPVVWLTAPRSFAQTTKTTFRIVPAAFGVALVLLLWLLRDAIGRPAMLVAALLTAISPAMVYYSRYYIHETLLVFFTLAVIATGWRYARGGKLRYCLAAGVSVGLVQATKETGVLAFVAMLSAGVLAAFCNRLVPIDRRTPRVRLAWWHVALGSAAALVVAVTLLSSFFANPRGPLDGLLTYLPWLRRAGGESPHAHPWYFYLQRLVFWRYADGPWWSEGLILGLAGAGLAASLAPRRWQVLSSEHVPFARWVGFYALALTAAYTVIPYKTPWCALSFLQAMILTAGIGAVAVIRAAPTAPLKAAVMAMLLAAAGHLGWQSHRAAFACPADPRNPYVYAHTLPDAERLSHDVQQLAAAADDRHGMAIDVVWRDAYYWPLPWYLRRFDRVAYWAVVPDAPAAPVVIASAEHDAALSERLGERYLMTGYYGLRPGALAQLWVRMDLWTAHLHRLGRL